MCAQGHVSGVPYLRLPSCSRAHCYGAAALLACSCYNAGENGMMGDDDDDNDDSNNSDCDSKDDDNSDDGDNDDDNDNLLVL